MTVRVGVVGTGHWGKNLVRNFHALGSLAAFSDNDPQTRDRIQGEYDGVMAFDNPDALIASPDVDALVFATPAVTHGALAEKALAAGKHVFVEKPMCLDLSQADRLIATSEKAGLTLMVGHLLLYHPAFQALCALIADGGIGDIRYIYSNRASLGKIRVEENALWSFAPHDVSMILRLVGQAPAKVMAKGNSYVTPNIIDTCITHLEFEHGVAAHIFISWLHPYKEQRLVVVGEKGMVVMNDTAAAGEKLLLYPHTVQTGEAVPLVSRADAEPIPFDNTEPLRSECAAFLHSIETGSKPPSNGEEGKRVLSVLAAAQASLEQDSLFISPEDPSLHGVQMNISAPGGTA